MKSLSVWVDELKSWDIPVLQRSVKELGKLAVKVEHLSAGKIVDVVLRDPLMTLKVLRLINGLSRSRLNNEITTVGHAVMMLGAGPFFTRISNLTAVEGNLAAVEGALPKLMQTMSRAHHAAWQAREWANYRAERQTEEIYIGALLFDIGEILLWAYAPDQALKIRKVSRRKKISTSQAQQEILGFTSRQLQFALAEAWNLPELMQASVYEEKVLKPRILGVTLAASVARLTQIDWYSPALLAEFASISELLHLSQNEVIAMVHRHAIAEARQWEWYGVPPAAALLPMLPGDWPSEPDDAELPQINSPAPVATMPEVKQLAHPEVLSQIMAEISAHLDGTLNLNEMLALVLKGMNEGIGLSRVVFALITADRTLKAKYIVGAEPNSPLRQFNVDISKPHVFSRLMEKPQGIWLSEANSQKMEPLLPFGIRQWIGQGEFFAMSIFLNGKPIGLFYADNRGNGRSLDDQRYVEFKLLCMRASQGLAHLLKK